MSFGSVTIVPFSWSKWAVRKETTMSAFSTISEKMITKSLRPGESNDSRYGTVMSMASTQISVS